MYLRSENSKKKHGMLIGANLSAKILRKHLSSTDFWSYHSDFWLFDENWENALNTVGSSRWPKNSASLVFEVDAMVRKPNLLKKKCIPILSWNLRLTCHYLLRAKNPVKFRLWAYSFKKWMRKNHVCVVWAARVYLAHFNYVSHHIDIKTDVRNKKGESMFHRLWLVLDIRKR